MPSKRQKVEYDERKALKKSGWSVSKRDVVAFNGPTEETISHIVSKALAAQILREKGYRVDSEVENDDHNVRADVLGYGCEGRNPCIIEFETEYSDELKKKNLEKYSIGPVFEVYTIEPPKESMSLKEAKEYIEGEI